jgi:hypothetical protein
MSRVVNTVAVEDPSSDLVTAVELLEHVGGTQFLAHRPSAISYSR